MTLTMTNERMGALVELLASLNETGKLGYAIARNLRFLRETAEEYLNLRMQIFRKYGSPVDGKENRFTVSTEDYQREMGAIPRIEHDFTPYQIDEETFTSGTLTSAQMESLLWMVKAPEES